MPNMKSLSLMVQKLWPRLKTHRPTNIQTGQKLDAPEFHCEDIKLLIAVRSMTFAIMGCDST